MLKFKGFRKEGDYLSVVNEERNYTVYIHINKINLKTYIGVTRQNPPEKRWINGLGYKNNEYFTKAIKKYGWDNFEHIILFKNKTKQEAEELEILFISILLSNNRTYGYNIDAGGNSTGKVSDETKEKQSKIRKGVHTGNDNSNSKKVICDNQIFDCIKNCGDYLGVSRRKVNDWLLNSYRMPQKYIDLGLRYYDKDKLKINQTKTSFRKKVICDGIVFDTLQKCCDYYNLEYNKVWKWLNELVKMPQKFKNLGLRYLTIEELIGELNMNVLKFEDVKNEYNVAINNVKILKESQSQIDKIISVINHQIENDEKVSASDGFKYFKILQNAQRKRRMIKEQLVEQQCIVNKFKPLIDSYSATKKNIEDSITGGKQKYVKNFNDVRIKLESIKTL